MARVELKWTEIDVENLSAPLANLHLAMTVAKLAFENGVIEAMRQRGVLTTDQTAVFTYRRGLAYAVTNKRGDNVKVAF